MNYRVRRATLADAPAIEAVCRAGSQFSELSQNLAPKEILDAVNDYWYNPDQLAQDIPHSGKWQGYYVAVDDDGEVVGATCGCVNDDGTGQLLCLFINPTLLRHGIGSALVNTLSDEQIELGAIRQLVYVAKGNLIALPFYKSVGFQIVEEKPRVGYGVPEDAGLFEWAMTRPLTIKSTDF